MITISLWLKQAAETLKSAGSSTPRLDAEILLSRVLKKNRAWLVAHSEERITPTALKTISSLMERRTNLEPLAYILGTVEFFGLDFNVNKHTLIPRPETETIIELYGQIAENVPEEYRLVDVGTGTGCIAITVKKLFAKNNPFTATDCSPEALRLAKSNCVQHQVDVRLIRGDLLEPLYQDTIDILFCNLPYVPDNFAINRDAHHEPRLAIFGGSDGLDLFRALFDQIKARTQKPEHIFTESLLEQHDTLSVIADQCGYRSTNSRGLAQHFTAIN